MANRNVILLSILAALLGGCASVPKEAGFDDVKKAVAERTGHLVQWRGRSADDAAVDGAVRDLLAKELTADDAVQVALLNNLNLQATYQDLGVAQADVVQAGLLKNPTFVAERRFSGQAAEFDVAQDFLDLFLLPLRKKVAAAEFEAAKLRVGQAVLETAADAQAAFYTLQGAEQMVEMRHTVLEAAEASADAARRLHEAGNINLLELRNEQRLASRSRLDLADAEAEVVQDRERLNVLMGVWGPNTNWTIANRLPDLPAVEVPAQGLESLAVGQRMDLGARRREIEAAARSLGITETFRYIPAITIGGHYEHEINPEHSVGPSVQFGVPLFDQGQAAVARGGALIAQAEQRYAALAVEIRSRVRAGYARMAVARSRAEYYRREILPLQQQILEQTQLQYNGMFFGVIQLLQAKQAQIDAGREYIDALREYWIARTELEKAVGGRLPGPAPDTTPGPGPSLPSPEMAPMKDMPGMPGMKTQDKKDKNDMQDMPGMPGKPGMPQTQPEHHHGG